VLTARRIFRYFASGTGAAGIVGAGLWWMVRGLGVRLGVGLSAVRRLVQVTGLLNAEVSRQVLPFTTPLVFILLLPAQTSFAEISDEGWTEPDATAEYVPVPTSDPTDIFPAPALSSDEQANPGKVSLTFEDKLSLVKPLFLKYMVPLFAVYTVGRLPHRAATLRLTRRVARVHDQPRHCPDLGLSGSDACRAPSAKTHYQVNARLLSTLAGARNRATETDQQLRPLRQLVYQTSVFLSRSSISLGLPALPARLLSLPAIVQAVILLLLSLESSLGIFASTDDSRSASTAIPLIFLLISIEGICGGLA